MVRRLSAASAALVVVFTVAAAAVADPADALNRFDFRNIVRDSKAKVFPAVVYIKCLRESHESGRKETNEVSGSGVLITSTGELLTNWHVVDKATEVRCLLFDGKHYDAEVVGTDKDLDLALIRLKMPAGTAPLPYAELGDSGALGEGDFVMAMGAPYGLSRSVSIGIVSCVRRYLEGQSEYSLWLQTDAAINPGNSGGPLVATDGRVIGINTLGLSGGGGLGFSIPADVIKIVVPRLREHGAANWAWTGLRLQPLRDFNRNVYFEGERGVIIASTDPESPARRAGVADHDRLVAINGQPVVGLTEEDLPTVRRAIGLLPIDKPAKLTMLREGKEVEVEITPREKGKVEGAELDAPRWDLTFKAINQFDNPDLFFHRQQGVFIFGIKQPGNAANSGLSQQDIVVKINGKDVATLDDVRTIHTEALANVENKPKILFNVLRNGLTRQVILDFSRDFEKD